VQQVFLLEHVCIDRTQAAFVQRCCLTTCRPDVTMPPPQRVNSDTDPISIDMGATLCRLLKIRLSPPLIRAMMKRAWETGTQLVAPFQILGYGLFPCLRRLK
jgi:hypothetical protein